MIRSLSVRILYLIFIISLCVPSSIQSLVGFDPTAQAYTSLKTIDGAVTADWFNSGASNEMLATSNTGVFTYVSWDNSNFYFASKGGDNSRTDGDADARHHNIYIGGVDGTSLSNMQGYTNSLLANKPIGLPFKAKYHIRYKLGACTSPCSTSAQISTFNGTAWTTLANAGTARRNTTNDVTEISIPRASIGNPSTFQFISYVVHNGNGNYKYATPSNLFPDNKTVTAFTNLNFFEFDIASSLGPAAQVGYYNFANTARTATTASFSFLASSGATSVMIQQSTDNGATWKNSTTTQTLSASSTSAIVNNLCAGTAYKFRLVVTGGTKAGSSSIANATTNADLTAPPVPFGLASSSITLSSFNLSWAPVADTGGSCGPVTFEVMLGANTVPTVSTTSTVATITQLNPNTAYVAKVRAKDAAGNLSAFSSTITVTTLKVFTVTFQSNGGSNVPIQYIVQGESATKPTSPTFGQSLFGGWYSDSGLTTPYNFSNPVNANVVLYAKWLANGFTVSFNSNGGSAVDSQIVELNGVATAPNAPTLSNNTFAGWYSDISLTTPYVFSSPVTSNLTLYAKWTFNSYTVSFVSNGGSGVAAQTIQHGGLVNTPTTPTRIGYTFAGWFSNSTLITPYVFSAPVTSNVTLYAKWTINSYTVSFVSNGGTSVNSQTVNHASAANVPMVPTRTGYGFSGWHTDVALTSSYVFSTPVTNNLTLYAKWTANIYTFSFVSNGGSAVNGQTVDYGLTAVTPTVPTRVGYTFAGWHSDSGLTNLYSFSTPVDSNLTLYAKWSLNNYSVTFDSNGGSAVSIQTVAHGGTASVPTAPTRTGYTFSGWHSNFALTSTYNFSSSVTSNITIYAKWTVNTFTVNFVSNGGSSVNSQIVNYGNLVTVPTEPVRTGYLFTGWFSDENLENTYNFGDSVIASFSLYAGWTQTSGLFIVSFNSNGGTPIDTQTVGFYSFAFEPLGPTMAGSVFSGWFLDANFETPFSFAEPVTANITLHAKWTAVSVQAPQIQFAMNGGLATVTWGELENATGYRVYINGDAVQTTGITGSLNLITSNWKYDRLYSVQVSALYDSIESEKSNRVLAYRPSTGLVREIASGWTHGVVLMNDGTVKDWGSNSQSQLGVPSSLSNVIAIKAGRNHALALKTDGTVVAWGRNGDGQATVPAGLTDVVAIAAGGYHSVALKADGTLVAWGFNGNDTVPVEITTIPAGLKDVVDVAAGTYHTIALKSDGSVLGWGLNANGQITAPATLTGVVRVAANGNHSLALKADGTVVAWGQNTNGQTDVPGNLNGVVDISAGGNHSLALKSDGKVVGWGRDVEKQISGLAQFSSQTITDISGGSTHSIILINNAIVKTSAEEQPIEMLIPEEVGGDLQAPTAPTNVTVVSKTGVTAKISWIVSTDNVGVSAYRVFVNGILNKTVTSPEVDLSGLLPATTYSITVVAIDAKKNKSEASAALSMTTNDTIAPSVPTDLVSSNITQTGFRVTWKSSTDNVAVTGYNVYLDGKYVATVTSLGYTFNGLTLNTNYSITVLAFDAANNRSAQSAGLNIKTSSTPPTVPTDLTASLINTNDFTLTWSASTDDGSIKGYNVYLNSSFVAFVTTNSYKYIGLTGGTLYRVDVLAIDNEDNRSARSTELTVTTQSPSDIELPSTPTGLVVSNVTSTGALVDWNNSSDNVGITGYNVYLNGIYHRTVTNSEITLSGLSQLTLYRVRVLAFDAAKNRSALSSESSFTTKDGIAPSVPTGLIASDFTTRGFKVSWTASTDNVGVDGYHIYLNGAYVSTVKNGITSYTANNLPYNQTHMVSVLAFDLAGNRSAKTTEIPVSTTYTSDWIAPNAPTDLFVTNVTSTSATLNWSAASDDPSTITSGVVKYHVYVNGVYRATVNGTILTFHINNLIANTAYSLSLRADDAAGNRSVSSTMLNVITLE